MNISDCTVKQNKQPPMKSNRKGYSNTNINTNTNTNTNNSNGKTTSLESPHPYRRLRFRHNQTNKNNLFWAHFRQRWRRNLIAGAGPVLILVLAILLRPTHNFHHHSAASASSEVTAAESMTYAAKQIFHVSSLLHYLPLVEAVPFLRRTSANNNYKPPKTALGVAAAQAQEAQTQAQSQETEETTTTTINNSNKRSSRNNNNNNYNKRKKSTSSTYNFPLIDNWEEFLLPNDNGNSNIPIPARYLDAYQQKEGPARKAVIKTLEWRREWKIDTILERPHPNYDIAKRILPHYFIGNSAKTNHVVFIQRPGFSHLQLAKHNGISLDDVLYQYAWVFEYCWYVL